MTMRPLFPAAMLVAVAFLASAASAAEAPPSRRSQTTYQVRASEDGSGDVYDMLVTTGGAVYLTGDTEEGPFLSRVEADGHLAWNAYEPDDWSPGQRGPLAIDAAGNAYLVMNNYFSWPNLQTAIVKYSASGARLTEIRPAPPTGVHIAANGIALDAERGHIYVSFDFLDTDGRTAILVVQYDLGLHELARNIYRAAPSTITNTGALGIGGIFVSSGGALTVVGLDAGSQDRNFLTRALILRYRSELTGRSEELFGGIFIRDTRSDPAGGMYGPFAPGYRKLAPELGPLLPHPGGSLIGVGAGGETYWRFQNVSRRVQKVDAAGAPQWLPFLVTDADKPPPQAARTAGGGLYLAGGYEIGTEFFYAYLDLYGGTTQQAFLIYSTGTDQVGDVGQPLPIPLEVLAQDASSAPVSGVAVGFAISSGPAGALLSVSSTATLGNGKASAVFTLGSIPLEYEVRATCSSCTAASNTVLFRACGKLPNDDFEQFDPRWSATTYDNTTQTMGAEGCAVSALAALNNFYRNTVSTAIPALDPDTLNRSLIGLGGRGYQPVGRLNWTGLTRLSGNTINFIELRDVDTASTIQDLISATDGDLARGRPVVIRVQRRRDNGTFGPHFVLAVGKCRGEYIIADPGSGTRVQFDPNDTNFELTGIRRFAPAL